MHSQRVQLAVAAAAGIVSGFLPWVSLGILSVSGTDGTDGWIVIGIFAVALICALTGTKEAALQGGGRGASIAMGVLGALMGAWKLSDVSSIAGQGEDNPFAKAVSPGAGLYLMLIAGIAVVVVAVRRPTR